MVLKLVLQTQSSKGGEARAKKLSKKRRSEIARKGAITRWGKEGIEPPAVARWGAADRPLKIGAVEIPCYVLADGTRVLAQRGLQAGIGLSEGGGTRGARRMAVLMGSLAKKGIDIKDLIARINAPIEFTPPNGGTAVGYEATILPDICAVVLEATRARKLQQQQQHLAERCGLLQHGFATVGIIALVDEATGYQDVRARDALAKILEKFVAKELRPWVKTFPGEFYREIFRLNGWPYAEDCGRPGVIGHWTTNIVYKRLAPGVWEELKRVTPRNDGGKPKNKYFQFLTEDVGDPRLREHIRAVILLMKYSPDWQTFMYRLDTEFPQWGPQLLLPFPAGYSPTDSTKTLTG